MSLLKLGARKLVWIPLLILAVPAYYLYRFCWMQVNHISLYRPPASAMKLADIPEITFREKWVCEAEWKWEHDSLDVQWMFPEDDGGLVYVDSNNSYFIGPEGVSREMEGHPRPTFSDWCSIIPATSSGYIVGRENTVSHLTSSGETLWQTNLFTQESPPAWRTFPALLRLPSGNLLAMCGDDFWELDNLGKVVSAWPTGLHMQRFNEVDMRPDGSIIFAGIVDDTHGGEVLVAAIDRSGRVLWKLPWKLGYPEQMVALPNGEVVMGQAYKGLTKFSPDGKRAWFIDANKTEYCGSDFVVGVGGVIVAWFGTAISTLSQSGKPIGQAIEFGTAPKHDISEENSDLLLGSDGNIYAQAEPCDERGNPLGSNTILALDPQGKPLWRIELGKDKFDLVAAGHNAELYGFRMRDAIASERYACIFRCDIVCLEPRQP